MTAPERERQRNKPLALVLRALGLGDLLTAVPALRALARAFPEHHRILACPEQLAPLALWTGTVDEVLAAEPLRPLSWNLGEPEVAVNLHGKGPQSHGVVLATRPRRLISFWHPDVLPSRGMPVWRDEEHEVHRWCRVLNEVGIEADPSDLELAPPPRAAAAPIARGATIIHPGAGSEARRWPAERFAAVAEEERGIGRRVVVTGSPHERPIADRVAGMAGLPADAVLAGQTDVFGLAATVAWAGRVISGDTGVAHLATAFGIPSVVLFGPVSPALWGPPRERPQHRVLWAGRTGDPHANVPDPGLLDIQVPDVLEALAELPARASRAEGGVDDRAARTAAPARASA